MTGEFNLDTIVFLVPSSGSCPFFHQHIPNSSLHFVTPEHTEQDGDVKELSLMFGLNSSDYAYHRVCGCLITKRLLYFTLRHEGI